MFFIFDALATKEEPKTGKERMQGLTPANQSKTADQSPAASQARVAETGAKAQKAVTPLKQGVKIEIREHGEKTPEGLQPGTMHVTFEKDASGAIAEALKYHDLMDTDYHAVLPMDGAEVTFTSVSTTHWRASVPVLLQKKGMPTLSGVKNIHPEVVSSIPKAYADMMDGRKLSPSSLNQTLGETALAGKTDIQILEFVIPTTLEGVRDRATVVGHDSSIEKPEDIVAANKIMQKRITSTGHVHELVSIFKNMTQNDLNTWMDKHELATLNVILYNMAVEWVANAGGISKESIIAQDFKEMPESQTAMIKTLGRASAIKTPKHKFSQSQLSKQLVASFQERKFQDIVDNVLTSLIVFEFLIPGAEASSTLARKAAKDEKFAKEAIEEQRTASQKIQDKIAKNLIELEKPFVDYNLALIEILEKKLPPSGSASKDGGGLA